MANCCLVAWQCLAPSYRRSEALPGTRVEAPASTGLRDRSSTPGAISASAIPRRIIQYWDQADPEFDYKCFDARARQFAEVNFEPPILAASSRASEPAQKSDIFRLAYLFAAGGFYVDADDRCLTPLAATMPPHATFAAYQEEYGTLGNNFLAAMPRDPNIGWALRLGDTAIIAATAISHGFPPFPGAFTRAFAQIVLEAPLRPEMWLAGAAIFERSQLTRAVASLATPGGSLISTGTRRSTKKP